MFSVPNPVIAVDTEHPPEAIRLFDTTPRNARAVHVRARLEIGRIPLVSIDIDAVERAKWFGTEILEN